MKALFVRIKHPDGGRSDWRFEGFVNWSWVRVNIERGVVERDNGPDSFFIAELPK